tara:strand:+ start:520 stop:1725 length:1206 start_codon:yes stop_codon:yes gene_type:complete
MATFRTDPDTGRTVISEANRVDRPISDFSSSDAARTVNRFDDDPRSGGFGPPVAGLDTGTGYMTRQEFENVAGMTDTNPYGRDGFFTRVFGIDPDKIDYTSNLGPRGIENVKRQAYDRFLNPFATTDAFGRPTMGADPAAGTTRSGVQPGDLTVFGPAVEAKEEGIAGLFRNTMLGSLMPKRARIPGYDANVLVPQMDLGGPQPGEGVDPQDRFPDGPPADVVRDPTATSIPTIEELTADREGRDIRRQEEQQQRTEREAQAVSAVLEMLQNAANNRDEARTPAATSIPTTQELLGDRIGRTVAELQAATAGFPDQFSVAPEVDFEVGQSATGEDFPVTISDVLQPPAAFTPEQVQRANENNVAMQRRAELMAQGMSVDAARMQAEREKLRARAAALGMGQ